MSNSPLHASIAVIVSIIIFILFYVINKETRIRYKITEARNLTGYSNNKYNPQLGMFCGDFLRKGRISARGFTGINPRLISNQVCTGDRIPSDRRLSNLVWSFLQFIDHTFVLTKSGTISESITVPSGDPSLPSGGVIPFTRSFTPLTNKMSSFIDCASIYSNDNMRLITLRKLDGTGQLKTDFGISCNEHTLPKNVFGLDNATHNSPTPEAFFVSGDIRANENILLTAIHTIAFRMHNCWIKNFLKEDKTILGNEELLFQRARKYTIAMIQHILYDEVLPLIIGPLPDYKGYDDSVDPRIALEFSTIGFRIGHSMIPDRVSVDNSSSILLSDMFFNPAWIDANGIDSILIGAAKSQQANIDVTINETLRSMLFGPPTSGMLLDLIALNIQRTRDHNIGFYNEVRDSYSLPKKLSFSDITKNEEVQTKLASVYPTVDDVDPIIGILAEDHLPNLAVGETVRAIWMDQFTRLRDGDRFWYENNQFTAQELKYIKSLNMRCLLFNTTSYKWDDIPENPFVVA